MKYATLFWLQGGLCVVMALMFATSIHPVFWVMLWPGIAFIWVGTLYALNRPLGLGKRDDGQIHIIALVLLAPFFALTWTLWHLIRLTSKEAPFDQITPTLYVGRRLLAREPLPKVGVIIDMTSEFNEPRAIIDAHQWHWLGALDATPPSMDTLIETLNPIIANAQSVWIHCAQGHGRSGLAAAMYLGLSGVAQTPEDALAQLQRARPGIGLSTSQLKILAKHWPEDLAN